jgi:hypothetical protein
MSWGVFQASAIGSSHIERQLPCQDACETWTNGNVLIAAVADGAGSASRSELGSTLCVTQVVDGLRKHFEGVGEQAEASGSLAASRSQLVGIIDDARKKIAELAASNSLEPRDLACTLVGVVAELPDKGFFFHIGDGCGIAEFEDPSISPIVSMPENGEYTNETWFVTVEEWKSHLRITPIKGSIGTIAVMSDGAMPFVMSRDQKSLYPEFFNPVANYLKQKDQAEGNMGLHSILASDRTKSITNDDKTLVLAFPN